MGPSLQRIVVSLLALALMLSCCQAQSVCSLSAGGYTYDLHSLGTVTVIASNPDALFNIPGGYTSASINFCAAACSDGSYACLVPDFGDPVPLCSGEPTGAFLNDNSPQLGATFECTDSTPESRPLKGFVGCGPAMASMAALNTPDTSGGGVSSYNFIVPAQIYCNGSGAGSS